MIDPDFYQEIAQSLGRHKLRTALTALGVFLGIFIFVLMVGFGPALEGAMNKRMAGFATNAVFMWGQRTSMPYAGMQPNRPIGFKNDDIEPISRIEGLEHLAPRNQLGGFRAGAVVKRGNKTGSFQVSGDYPAFQYIQTPVMRAGRYINDADIEGRRKVAVVGEEVAKQLFEGQNAIGGALEVNGIHFEVVGVFGSKATGQQGDNQVRQVIVPFTTFQQAFHFGDHVSWFAMTAKPGTNGADLEKRVRQLLAERHRIHPEDEMAIGGWNAAERFAKTEKLFWAVGLVLGFAGLMSLLAGAIGVSNIMLITVRERTKEIGVRKALGATPASVVMMVVAEATFLTMVAGYIGLVAGVGMIEAGAWAVDKAGDKVPIGAPFVSVEFAAAATVILIVVGAFAGLIPALRAAAIQPIEALRDE
ncbi:MAG: ABC transporter permease [Kofleriaceae bacterium]|nr:MAG: ABC transporter permease [Kofleriaceae bacterium]MBZ0231599.1 ABC transporter permease [Kofleriaceae bacterium]